MLASSGNSAATDNALLSLSVAAAARAIHTGDLTAEAYAITLLDHYRRHLWLNAFIRVDAELLLQAARDADRSRAAGRKIGPLHGVPFAIKDNIETKALTTSAGTGTLRDFRPGRNAPVAQHLFDAGGLMFGKANMHELALGTTTNNPVYGAAQNPYKRGYHPSGSSGGTASAIAARVVPGGLGSDTIGSVRMPGSLCGLVGLRPTTGRYRGTGIVPVSVTHDTVGPMARTVEDVALMDGVLSGNPVLLETSELTGVRLGVPRPFFWDALDLETERVCTEALAILKEHGAILVETPMDEVLRLSKRFGLNPVLFEAMRDLPVYLAQSGAGIPFEALLAGVQTPNVQGLLKLAASPDVQSETAYREALEIHKPALERAYADYFQDNEVVAAVVPTTPLPSRPHHPEGLVEFHGEMVEDIVYLRNIEPASHAGIPSINVPAGMTTDGLPVGLLFDGPKGREQQLLNIAAAFERAAPAVPPPLLA